MRSSLIPPDDAQPVSVDRLHVFDAAIEGDDSGNSRERRGEQPADGAATDDEDIGRHEFRTLPMVKILKSASKSLRQKITIPTPGKPALLAVHCSYVSRRASSNSLMAATGTNQLGSAPIGCSLLNRERPTTQGNVRRGPLFLLDAP